jgi:hypothetical protein
MHRLDSTKIDLTEIVYEMEWIELHQKGVQWKGLENAKKNIRFTLKVECFMTRYATSSLSVTIVPSKVIP